MPTESVTVSLFTETDSASVTEHPTDTVTLRLPPAATFYTGFDGGNDSIIDTMPYFSTSIDKDRWVDPPYSLRVEKTVAQIKLGGDGVLEPRGVSWWFYLPKGTEIASFFLATDYVRDFLGNTPHEHLWLRASVVDGLYIESELMGQSCGVHNMEYSILQETWHQAHLQFNYAGATTQEVWRNMSHLAATVSVSLDGVQLCDGILWNHTSTVVKQLHVAPQQYDQDAWCSNMTMNATCDGSPLISLNDGDTPCFAETDANGTFLSPEEREQLCLVCCRKRSVHDYAEGCCQYDLIDNRCYYSRRLYDGMLHTNDTTFRDDTNPIYNGTRLNITLDTPYHKASICTLKRGLVYVDRIFACDKTDYSCDLYSSVRPFNCSKYNSYTDVTRLGMTEGPDFMCNKHPRCIYHASAQRCVEDALSEMRGAWLETQGTDLLYTSAEKVWYNFASRGEGRWMNGSAIGITTMDERTDAHDIAVLRSTEFIVGWHTEIEIFVNSSDIKSSQGTDDIRGPILSNVSAIHKGFMGAAIQWNGAWVASKRICEKHCSFTFTAEDLREFVHQTVTVDLIDMDVQKYGYYSIRGVEIRSPAQSVPAFPTGWGLGRPCGGVLTSAADTTRGTHWSRVTCSLGMVSEFDLAAMSLTGTLGELDFSMYGNMTRLDLSENSLNGTIDDELLPAALLNLSLASNPIATTLPVFLNLRNIQHINFSKTAMHGEIPARWLMRPDLSDTLYLSPAELRTIDLDYTTVSGTIPEGFERHATIETFRVYGAMLTGTIPNPVGSKLVDLELSYNDLTGVAPFRAPGGIGEVTNVGLAQNTFVGLIPKWISHARSFALGGNTWCCPIPHWARAPSPHYAPNHPASLAWARERPLHSPIPTCTKVALSEAGSVFGVCPTVVGTCDGSVTCGQETCSCDSGAPTFSGDGTTPFSTFGHEDQMCPTYLGCGCDMRRRRCVYRPQRPQCNSTTGGDRTGVCIDEKHSFDVSPHPAFNPYYGGESSL